MQKVSNAVVEQLKVTIQNMQQQIDKKQEDLSLKVSKRDEKLKEYNAEIEQREHELTRLHDEMYETQQALDILVANLPTVESVPTPDEPAQG